jgi:hypothetical protein
VDSMTVLRPGQRGGGKDVMIAPIGFSHRASEQLRGAAAS